MYAYSVRNIKTNETFVFQENESFCTASIVKVAVAMALFYEENKKTHQLTDVEYQKLSKMIIESDNKCTTYFWNKLGGEKYMDSFFQKLGMNETNAGKNGYWGLTETTASNQISLLTYLVKENKFINKHQQTMILHHMEHVKQDQKWGYSSIKEGKVYVKNGWSPKEKDNWRINSLGIVEHAGDVYVLCMLTIGNESYSKGIQRMEDLAEEVMNKIKKENRV
jgi:hypothetical protein